MVEIFYLGNFAEEFDDFLQELALRVRNLELGYILGNFDQMSDDVFSNWLDFRNLSSKKIRQASKVLHFVV
jgi:hypothetical protein